MPMLLSHRHCHCHCHYHCIYSQARQHSPHQCYSGTLHISAGADIPVSTMKQTGAFLILANIAFTACYPAGETPFSDRSDYRRRLNLDKYRTKGVYGNTYFSDAFRGGVHADAGAHEDGGVYGKAQAGGGGEGTAAAGLGLNGVSGSGQLQVRGHGDMTGTVKANKNSTGVSAGGQLSAMADSGVQVSSNIFNDTVSMDAGGDAALSSRGQASTNVGVNVDEDGYLRAVGEMRGKEQAGINGSAFLGNTRSRGDMGVTGDGRLHAKTQLGADDSVLHGSVETGASGEGVLTGGVAVIHNDDTVAHSKAAATGKGKVVARGGMDIAQSRDSVQGGGTLAGEVEGRLSSRGGIGNTKGEALVGAIGGGHITADAGVKGENGDVHGGGQLGAEGSSKLYGGVQLGEARADADMTARGQGDLTAGGGYKRDQDGGAHLGGETGASGIGELSTSLVLDREGKALVMVGHREQVGGRVSAAGAASKDATGIQGYSALGAAGDASARGSGGVGALKGDADATSGVEVKLTAAARANRTRAGAELGVRGSSNLDTAGRLMKDNEYLEGRTGLSAEGDGKLSVGAGYERPNSNSVHGDAAAGLSGSGNLKANAGMGSVRSETSIGAVADGVAGAALGVGIDDNGVAYGRGDVGVRSRGNITGGVGLVTGVGSVHGDGQLGADGGGKVSGHVESGRHDNGTAYSAGDVGASAEGALNFGVGLRKANATAVKSAGRVIGGAGGGVSASVSKDVNGAVQARVQGKAATMAGFSFRLWPFS